jgi:hypothetical protein
MTFTFQAKRDNAWHIRADAADSIEEAERVFHRLRQEFPVVVSYDESGRKYWWNQAVNALELAPEDHQER